MTKERDIHIDILRCIGLLLVILAHIPINETIKSIRSFDVMLLVFIAGMSFVKSETNNFKYKQYLIGRIKRLCIPTWITLAFIFALASVLCVIAHREYLYSVQQILESILFIGGMSGGIGNVWIVRIYMLLALSTPIYIWIEKRIDNRSLICLFIFALTINEIVIYAFYSAGTLRGAIVENIVSSLLAYSVGFLSGARIAKQKTYSFLKSELLVLLPIFIVVQIRLFVSGIGFAPNSYKYPPHLYYTLYGIIVSILLYILCYRITIKKDKIQTVIVWISKKSFDIYLSHTVILKLLSWGDAYIKDIVIFRVGILYYLFVLVGSIVLVLFKDLVNPRAVRLRK